MASGDGLIVRLRIVGGALTPALARAVAGWAADHGNGLIDLTSRANLQLRGVGEHALTSLQAELSKWGLLDTDPAAEAVRNILSSPLAGLDPKALIDIRPLVEALDDRLKSDSRLHGLPAKFGFAIDDGGSLPLSADMADIAFVARGASGKAVFAVHFGGRLTGLCAPDNLVECAVRLALATEPRPPGIPAEPVKRGRVTGIHDIALGVGIPFGRLDSPGLELLAAEAETARGELRLTPWRAILIAGPDVTRAAAERLAVAGFVLDDDAPVRALAACPGAPACSSASTDTRADALALAALVAKRGEGGIALHVSGCAKGCAHSRTAPVTLVGTGGFYDVVLDGRADGVPARRGLSLADIALFLESGTP